MAVTALDPDTALLVLDLQRGTLQFPLVHAVDDIVKRANALSDAFRRADLPVVLVIVDDVPPGRTEAPRHHFEITPEWVELIPELDQHPADLRVTKKSSGAFARTGLEDMLRIRGVTQVILAGVATGGAADSTARQAYELGFNVTMAVDAMTDVSLERHEHTISTVFPQLGETGTTEEILALLHATR